MIDDELLAPSVAYCWVDEDDERVSPKHNELGHALSWYERRPTHRARLKKREGEINQKWPDNERMQAELNGMRKKLTLTGKEPVVLKRIVTRRTVEETTPAEQAIIEQIRSST